MIDEQREILAKTRSRHKQRIEKAKEKMLTELKALADKYPIKL